MSETDDLTEFSILSTKLPTVVSPKNHPITSLTLSNCPNNDCIDEQEDRPKSEPEVLLENVYNDDEPEMLNKLCLQNTVGVSPDNHPIPTFVPLSGIVPNPSILVENITIKISEQEPVVESPVVEPEPANAIPLFLHDNHPIPTFLTSLHPLSGIVPKLVFIVPYRDREAHYKIFSSTMKSALEKWRPYKILYVHQKDNRSFNRGAMKNIGFLVIKKMYPLDYRNITLVFNDIDTMPSSGVELNYDTQPGNIKHFYGFDYTLGGIVSIKGGDFERLNGFPNFWAWGFEDNLLQMRANKLGIKIDRSEFYKIRDPKIIQLTDSLIREVNREEYDRFLKNTSEGISSITDLDYTVDNNTGFIDVLNFNTTVNENLQKRTDYDLRNGPAPFKPPLIRRKPVMRMHF